MMGRAGKTLVVGSLLAFIVGAWLLGCQQRPAVERIKAEPLIILPADATIVGGVSFSSMAQKQGKPKFAEKMLGSMLEEAKEIAERIKTKGNLHLPEDLDRALFGLSKVEQAELTFTAVFQGRFDPAAITTAVKEEIQDCTFEDKTFDSYKYTVAESKQGDRVVFGFPVSEFAVLSNNEEALKTAMGQFAKPANSVMDNKEMTSLLANIDRTSDFWVIGLVPGKMEESVKDAPQFAALGKLKKFSMMVKATKGFNLELAGYCTTADEASGVKDVIASLVEQSKFFIGLIPQSQELMKLYDKIQISAEGSTAKLSFSLSEEEAKQLEETFAKMKEEMEKPEPTPELTPEPTPEPTE